MSLGLAISGFLPSIVSKGIFAPRRVGKAERANNAIVSTANVGIADAQVVKAGEGLVGIARESKNSIAKRIVALDEAVKEGSKTNTFLRYVGKGGQFAIDNINTLITCASIFQILTADDKERESVEQLFLLGGMFGAEGAYKAITGMAKTKRVNGKSVVVPVDGLYKKSPFVKKQVEAFKDYCATKKLFNHSLKHAPAVIKGVGFALASIGGSYAGYNFVGKPVANALFGKEEDKKQNKKSIKMTFNPAVSNKESETKQYYNAA